MKCKCALVVSRDLDLQCKTVFILSLKIREAMATELKGMHMGGDGETVEVGGRCFGGYIKPASHNENRRLAKNQNSKRQVVVVVRERGGSALPAVLSGQPSDKHVFIPSARLALSPPC